MGWGGGGGGGGDSVKIVLIPLEKGFTLKGKILFPFGALFSF